MAKLKTSPDFMPRVVENFLGKIRTIYQLSQRARNITDPINVMEAYKVCKIAIDELTAIEAVHSLSSLKPYLEDHTNEPDWSIYQADYNNLVSVDVPAFLLAVESNVGDLSISSISAGSINWAALPAAKIAALQTLLDSILVRFE